jgi:hypothetical protein
MNNEIAAYMLKIAENYKSVRYVGLASDETTQKMNKQFEESLNFSEGKSYIRIMKETSVHSFIVKEDGPKFKKGDILKAASYSAPAKNFTRGNIFNPESFENVSWTGA